MHFRPDTGEAPFPESSLDSFSKAWRQYCRHVCPRVFAVCVAGPDQMCVCVRSERATAMPNIQPVEIHSSGARAHAAPGIMDRSSKLDIERFEGNLIVMTAGGLSEQTMPDPGFYLVIAGRVLVVIQDPINAPGPVMAVLSSGHRLVVAPGTKIGIYAIEPTIMFSQAFLDYRCIEFIHREDASLELKAYAIWMGEALSDRLWMAYLGDEKVEIAQRWTREALQKMADDMVAKRPWLEYKPEHEGIGLEVGTLIRLYRHTREVLVDLEEATRG